MIRIVHAIAIRQHVERDYLPHGQPENVPSAACVPFQYDTAQVSERKDVPENRSRGIMVKRTALRDVAMSKIESSVVSDISLICVPEKKGSASHESQS